jgi:hypothetical protein
MKTMTVIGCRATGNGQQDIVCPKYGSCWNVQVHPEKRINSFFIPLDDYLSVINPLHFSCSNGSEKQRFCPAFPESAF